jgi:hypothetical protein
LLSSSSRTSRSAAGHLRATNDLQALTASFRFELLERLLDALRCRVQLGARHRDVRVSEGRLNLVQFPARFEQLRPELVAQVVEPFVLCKGEEQPLIR